MNAPDKHISTAAIAGIDIDVLRTFAAIAETGSFSKAAEKVFRTPSAVSMQIKKLEDNLGVSVFERDSRSVTLTQDGELLLSYTRRILALSNEMIARFIMPDMNGTVRVGAPDDYGDRVIPPLLRRFAESHPNVSVDVVIETTGELKKRFEKGELDVMLFTSHSKDAVADNETIVLEDQLVWAGVKGGCAWEKEPLPLSMWEKGCVWRANAVEALDEIGRSYRVAYLSAHNLAQRAAVIEDLAVAPFAATFIRPPLVRLGEEHGLPQLGTFQIRMKLKDNPGCCSEAVADHLIACFENLRK